MYRDILPEELKVDRTLGYVYFIDKEHPLAYKGVNKVYYHRHIASIKYGRWLTKEDAVHHVDNNKQNNDISNLEVLTHSEHGKLHSCNPNSTLLEKICPVCGNTFEVNSSQANIRVTCSIKCSHKRHIVWDITKEELEELIWNRSFTHISKEYPISDVGAKKKAAALGCKMPPPYFFNKTEQFRSEQRKLNNIPDLPTQ